MDTGCGVLHPPGFWLRIGAFKLLHRTTTSVKNTFIRPEPRLPPVCGITSQKFLGSRSISPCKLEEHKAHVFQAARDNRSLQRRKSSKDYTGAQTTLKRLSGHEAGGSGDPVLRVEYPWPVHLGMYL